jgi:hypothetical protein
VLSDGMCTRGADSAGGGGRCDGGGGRCDGGGGRCDGGGRDARDGGGGGCETRAGGWPDARDGGGGGCDARADAGARADAAASSLLRPGMVGGDSPSELLDVDGNDGGRSAGRREGSGRVSSFESTVGSRIVSSGTASGTEPQPRSTSDGRIDWSSSRVGFFPLIGSRRLTPRSNSRRLGRWVVEGIAPSGGVFPH